MQEQQPKNYSEGEEELEGEMTLTASDKIPYSAEKINIEKARYSLYELKRKIDRGGEIILNPDFQRESVWDSKQKSELIESILLGIPISVMYFFQMKDATIHIVDGKQRMSTIVDFINNQFELSPLRILTKTENKKFEDLSSIEQRKIEDYQIDVYLIKPPTPESIKFDIFDRVNRGGTKLNRQEIRNALYQGHATKLIKELSELESFKKATGNSISPNRMKDRYIILRFLAFYLFFTQQFSYNEHKYTGNIDDFLTETMKFLNTNDNLINPIKSTFIRVIDFVAEHFDSQIFRFPPSNSKTRPVNMALFECLMFLFALCLEQNIPITEQDIKTIKDQFDESPIFKSGIDSAPSVTERFEQIKQYFQRLKHDHTN